MWVVNVLDQLEPDNSIEFFAQWDRLKPSVIDFVGERSGLFSCSPGHLSSGPKHKVRLRLI